VHGGTRFTAPVKLDPATIGALRDLIPLAPLHQPHNVAAIEAVAAARPDVPQVACFDTAFHATLPPGPATYALPAEWPRRRFGFHGLSHAYASRRAAELRLVSCHLGAGASLAALRSGRCVDTTMGFTPASGLVMGTRSGDLDPGLVAFLAHAEGMTPERFHRLLYHESGLLGVSGTSADMRTLLASSEAAAREAARIFSFRAAQQVAMMTTSLGGLDCLVFTGGIGEHAKEIRGAIGERLAWMGVRIDAASNDAARERINGNDSTVEVFVIPTNEEMMIARHCAALI